MGPDANDIERIVAELRRSVDPQMATGEPLSPPTEGQAVGAADTTPGAKDTRRFASLRSVSKLFLGRAVRWQLGATAVEMQRIGGELDRWERLREAQHAEAQATTADLQREIAALRDRLRRIERSAGQTMPAHPAPAASVTTPAGVHTVDAPTDPQANLDYFAFEALMRGSTEEIANRQAAYLKLLDGVDDILDVGCGRGELLLLLVGAGKRVQGVDVNQDMVARCVDSGLDVQLGDGNTFLASGPAGSLGGIVALQVVEHLTPAELVAFLELSRRALRPDGLMVLETINPASLSALRNYFADLTHRQPLVPQTLAFLAESAGFRDVRIEYLNPLPEIARLRHVPYGERVGEGVQAASDRNVDLVNAALFGPQDFAVIARA